MDHRTTAVINGPLREAKFHDRPGETPVTRRAESAILDFTQQSPHGSASAPTIKIALDLPAILRR